VGDGLAPQRPPARNVHEASTNSRAAATTPFLRDRGACPSIPPADRQRLAPLSMLGCASRSSAAAHSPAPTGWMPTASTGTTTNLTSTPRRPCSSGSRPSGPRLCRRSCAATRSLAARGRVADHRAAARTEESRAPGNRRDPEHLRPVPLLLSASMSSCPIARVTRVLEGVRDALDAHARECGDRVLGIALHPEDLGELSVAEMWGLPVLAWEEGSTGHAPALVRGPGRADPPGGYLSGTTRSVELPRRAARVLSGSACRLTTASSGAREARGRRRARSGPAGSLRRTP
jgi:hypothetical protein